jgi:sigma-B regulation protein RsbU (phosphoserine phosphatase)
MTPDAGASRSAEKRIQQLLLLQETVKKINSILDLDQLLDEIVGDVALAFGCTRSAVLLLDETADELVIAAVRGFDNVHLKGYRFQVGGEGILGYVGATRKMYYAPNVRLDPHYTVSERSTMSEVDIPLFSRGRFIGIFNAQSPVVDAFSPEQLDLLSALADNIAIAVENARLFQHERLQNETAVREQAEARRIQRALLPSENPPVPGYDVRAICLQLSAVGGDWYDFIPLPDDRWGIVLADVSGKGTAAALLMAASRSLFRRAALGTTSAAEALTTANHALLLDLPDGRFVTLAYLVLEASRGAVKLASAGHPLPLLRRRTGDIDSVQDVAGPPLGLLKAAYQETELQMGRGDTLVLCSDGVLEARDEQGAEYGDSAVREYLRSTEVRAERMIEDVRRFTRSRSMQDDATVVTVTRTE